MNNIIHKTYDVRLYCAYERQWFQLHDAINLSKEQADEYWNKRTSNGKVYTKFEDSEYYCIFPSNTKMLYSKGFGEI